MIAVGNRAGYAGATVSAVIAEAGVSKPTFYDYFEDRDECFEAALLDVHAGLLQTLSAALEIGRPERAPQAAVGEMIGFAASHPLRARFLMAEAMAGGPRALDARDRSITELAGAIDTTVAKAELAIADIPSRVLVGAVYRLLSSRLRRGEPAIAELLEPALEWVESYAVAAKERRWQTLGAASTGPPVSPAQPQLRAPRALGPGRPRISEEQVAQTQRQRIMFAAAALAEEKGYLASTVDDITKLARVDRRAFYGLFSDKRDAFMAVHELGLQEVMAVSAGAFFTGASWPERIWEGGAALARFLEANPTIAHVGFVEAYSVGPGAAQRVEDSQAAFAIFLQEGYTHREQAVPPSRVVLEAIIKSIFEIIYLRARASTRPALFGTLPYMTFLSLAPFIGVEEANAFVEEKAKQASSDPVRSGRAGGRTD
jgi:AcrR family transcriptional regulator